MLAPSSSTVRSSRSASNAPPALSPRDTLADSLVSGRENASTDLMPVQEYRMPEPGQQCRCRGKPVQCSWNVSTPESRSTVPASHAIGSAHMAQRLSPIDAMSRMQTVSSTTVLPHERPVNTVSRSTAHVGDMAQAAETARLSCSIAGAECRIRSDVLTPDTGQCTDRTRECSGVHALPVGGKIQ